MRKIGIIFFLCLGLLHGRGQALMPAVISGGGGVGTIKGSLNVAYTMGEPVIETLIGSSILTQGFHQPFGIKVVSTQEPGIEGLQAFLYPNPSNELAFLHVKADQLMSLQVETWDNLGQLLSVTSATTAQPVLSLSLRNLPAATYQVLLRRLKTGEILALPLVKL